MKRFENQKTPYLKKRPLASYADIRTLIEHSNTRIIIVINMVRLKREKADLKFEG